MGDEAREGSDSERCQVALLGLSPGYHRGAFKEI